MGIQPKGEIDGPIYLGMRTAAPSKLGALSGWWVRVALFIGIASVWLSVGFAVAVLIHGHVIGIGYGLTGAVAPFVFWNLARRHYKDVSTADRQHPAFPAVCERLANRTSRGEFGPLLTEPGMHAWITSLGVFEKNGRLQQYSRFETFSIEAPNASTWSVLFWRVPNRASRGARVWLMFIVVNLVAAAIWTAGLVIAVRSRGFGDDAILLALVAAGYAAMLVVFGHTLRDGYRKNRRTGRVTELCITIRSDSVTVRELAGFLKRFLPVEDSVDEMAAQSAESG